MDMSNRHALALLDAMFPGEAARGVPAASATRVASSLISLCDIGALLGDEVLPDDPNAALKLLRGLAPDLVDSFVREAVVGYFADPVVARALTGKPTPLFPTQTIMPDIDFALLEPVLQKFGHADD